MNGTKRLRKTRRFIYLISPNNIVSAKFYKDLNLVLKTGKISFFQLRLKNKNKNKVIKIGKKIRKICKKYKVKFILNDQPKLSKLIDADGCHLGQKDMALLTARKILKNKIIGVTCHNSKKLIKKAILERADYIAVGAFYSTKTKKVVHKADLNLLKTTKKIAKVPVVAVGGINSDNYKKLLLNKANFLAISGYIWNNKKLSPLQAIRKLK